MKYLSTSELHALIHEGKLEEIKKLDKGYLEKHKNRCFLEAATYDNRLMVLNFFHEMDIEKNVLNRALELAAMGGSLLLLDMLIGWGATELNAALRAATRATKLMAISFLIDKGANNFGECLEIAAYHNIIDSLQFFIRNYSYKIESKDLNNALMEGAKGNSIESMELLALAGAYNLNEAVLETILWWDGKTPPKIDAMMWCAKKGATNLEEVLEKLDNNPWHATHPTGRLYREILVSFIKNKERFGTVMMNDDDYMD